MVRYNECINFYFIHDQLKFGEVESKLAQKTGKRMSNIKLRITINNRPLDEFGVISSDCLGAHMIGMVGVYTLQWITEKEAAFVGITMSNV